MQAPKLMDCKDVGQPPSLSQRNSMRSNCDNQNCIINSHGEEFLKLFVTIDNVLIMFMRVIVYVIVLLLMRIVDRS